MKFHHGDIFQYSADYLISSGNPYLNMSGGVNAQMCELFGQQLQVELHSHFNSLNVKFLNPGYAYLFKQKIGKYLGVTYCVGIDVWYESTKEIVKESIKNSMKQFGDTKDSIIAISAMATGYGKLYKSLFGKAMRELDDEMDCKSMVVIIKDEYRFEEIVNGYNEK